MLHTVGDVACYAAKQSSFARANGNTTEQNEQEPMNLNRLGLPAMKTTDS